MSQASWFYLKDGKAVGPVSRENLLSLAVTAEISADTQIFEPKASVWRSYREVFGAAPPPLPAGANSPASVPPVRRSTLDRGIVPTGFGAQAATSSAADGLTGTREDRNGWSNEGRAPWRRYFARSLDIWVNGFIGIFLFDLAFFALAPQTAERFLGLFAFNSVANGTWLAFLGILAAIPVSALMLGLTGTTVGKVLFGVRVMNEELEPIGFRRAVLREFGVWVAGLGLGLPGLSLVTTILSYRRLKSVGATLWDSSLDLAVLHRPLGGLQYFLFAVASALFGFMAELVRFVT